MFRVNRFIKQGETIDLGGVKLKVIPAGGHNPDEAVFYDQANNILYSGDYIYPSFLINANTKDYLKSTDNVLDVINKDIRIFCAHAGKYFTIVPQVTFSDVMGLKKFLTDLMAGKLKGETIDDPRFKIKSAQWYEINGKMSFVDEVVWDDGVKYTY